jgi:hypothetical protein
MDKFVLIIQKKKKPAITIDSKKRKRYRPNATYSSRFWRMPWIPKQNGTNKDIR